MADPVQQNVSQTTIPDYARPYVERMLGRTEGLTDINQNPYQAYGDQRIAGFTPMQAQAFQNIANQRVAGQIGEGSNLASTAGRGMLGTVNPAGQYGQLGAGYGSMAAGMAPQAQNYGQQAVGYGQQASQAGNQYNAMATNPYAVQAYMNPYLQASLAPQLQMMDIQNAQQQAKNQAQAVGQGAFGGSRQAVMQGQNQFNNALTKQNLIGQGYNTAFQNAQQAQQFGANLGLQGLQTGLQGQQIGLQGLQQAGNLYGQGMTGAQIGLQGIGAQQAGYSGANLAAQNLGNLGQTQFAQQQAITNDMQRAGAVQQAQQQQGLDVAYQNYLNQKNYPYQQLAFQSDMLRGVPLSQTSTSMYQAPPNLASQAGGLGMTALGVYGMSGGFKGAKGGLMDAKAFKEGGKIGYTTGGDISMMSTEQLMKMLDNPTLRPMERDMIEEQLMIRRRMAMNPEAGQIMAQGRSGIGAIGTGDMVPEDIATGAGGGIVAFATGDVVKLQKAKSSGSLDERIKNLEEREAAAYQNLYENSNAFEKSKAAEEDIRKQIASSKETAPWEALTYAGLGALQGNPDPALRQNFLSNMAYGAEKGLGAYGKRSAEQNALNKLLLTQGVEQEKTKYGRDVGNLNALTASLGQAYNRQAMQNQAGAGGEEKALLRVQALINQDDQLPLLYKQRDMYEPSDPKYKAYNDAINSIKKSYFEQAGIKRPYVAPAAVQLPEEVKEPGFFERIFGGSKPTVASKTPGVMKFDKNGNPV